MKRLAFLTALLLIALSMSSQEREAYAVYDFDAVNFQANVLTLYYDTEKATRSGLATYDVGDGTVDPGWYDTENASNVEVVNIDPSFLDARLKGGYHLFAGLQSLQKIVGMQYLNTSEMTTMESMFSGCWDLKELDLSHFDTRNVSTMRWMFGWATELENLDLRSFDTRNVADMSHMFYECMDMKTVDLSSFNTSNVADFSSMFDIPQHSYLTTIYASEEFVTTSATAHGKLDMFVACTSLVGGSGSHFDATCTSADYARIDGGLSNPGYFTYKAPTLWVGGTQVTRDNKDDILGDGKVEYNVGAKTLTLIDAAISGNGDNIRSEVPGLIVRFEGTNTLRSNSANILSLQSDITLTGSGKVSMESNAECMSVTGDYTRIDGGLFLKAKGGSNGYFAIGSESTPAVLTIAGIRTRVEAFSPNEVLQGFLFVKLLDGQQFTTPAGATYDYNKGLVDNYGNIIKNQSVVIEVPLEKTNLWIGNTEVTNHNADDVLGDGSVVYDSATKTLVLNNLNLLLNETCIMNGTYWNYGSGIDGLTIQVNGDCSLRSTEQALYLYDCHTTITGKGKLSLVSDSEAGIALNFNCTLTLKDADVEVIGYGCAINSFYTNFMKVNHSRLTASANHTSLPTISNLEEFSLIDSHYNDVVDGSITYGAEYFFFEDGNGICWDDSGGYQLYYGTVSISPDIRPGDTYDLKIADTQVTGSNCADILGDGVFSYDPVGKTLHVKGNYTGSSSQNIINSSIEGLTISVEENSQLTVNATHLYDDVYLSTGSCMVLGANTTITGAGKLTLKDLGDMCIYLPKDITLTIKDANLTANGCFGIYSQNKLGATLRFVNSTVNLTARSDGGVIRQVKEVVLTDCHYTNLGYHYFSSTEGDMYGANGLLTSLQIVPNTPAKLWIAGQQVQYSDYQTVMLGGAITYSYDAKQLQINKDVDVSTMNGIQALVYSEEDGLDIVISKEATLTTGDVPVFWLRGNTTMWSWEGSKATLQSDDRGIYVSDGKKLTLEDVNLQVNAKCGIVGTGESTKEKLILTRANVGVSSTENGIADFLGSITLRSSYIIQPSGGKVYGGAVVDKDGNVARYVTISKNKSDSPATAIDSVETESDAESTPVYNLSGQRISGSTLKKGVYIIGGKKVLR